MEWIEITARTVEEAKELALDRLMVNEEDVEFDVLAEPRQGLFGRLRGEARVRARVKPSPVRQKVERRDRRRGGGGKERTERPVKPTADPVAQPAAREVESPHVGADTANGEGPGDPSVDAPGTAEAAAHPRRATRGRRKEGEHGDRPGREDKEQDVDDSIVEGSTARVGEEAVRFVDGLLAAFGLEATTNLTTDGTELEVTVEGDDLGLLVGPRGATLQAVQDLARVAAQRRLHDHETRLRVDIAGYRRRRSESLAAFVAKIAEDVQRTGVARVLEPMSSADRKVIHDSLTDVEAITTRSEGEEPFRRVVIAPAVAAAPADD